MAIDIGDNFGTGDRMTEQPASLSRVAFDRLIARAIKLDEEGNERIDLERARAIADELGISASAWEAALRERGWAQEGGLQGAGLRLRGRPLLVALVGLAAGALSGALANRLGDGVLLLGGMAVAAAVGLVLNGWRRRSVRSTQVELAAWWLSVPVGIMLGLRAFHGDPVVFASVAWAGCASLGFALERLGRRDPSPSPLADTPTA